MSVHAVEAAPRWRRYTTVAIALHWVIAAMIVFQLAIGLWLADALDAADDSVKLAAFEQTQLHKSVGLTILLLTVLRLMWRFLNPPPPLPAGMPAHERFLAHLSHILFYALMLGLPLSGWAMASASVAYGNVPTVYFGVFKVPHLPFLPELGADAKQFADASLQSAHATLGWVAIGLIALHVAAALKHHFVDRDAVLARMTPGVSPRDAVVDEPVRTPPLGARVAQAGVVVILAAVGAYAVVAYDAGRPDAGAPRADLGPAPEMQAAAPEWTPIAEESEIAFSGAYSGDPFRGTFSVWRAQIAFDPEQLDASETIVEIETGTAATGNAWYDPELVGSFWFDAATHPTALFQSTTFRRDPGADTAEGLGYVASGALTLRGVEQPFDLPFVLRIDGDRATMTAQAEIDRVAFGVGVDASEGASVTEAIGLEITLIARRVADATQ